jgi:Na+-exporting ATPase
MDAKKNGDKLEHISGQSNKPISSPAHALSFAQVAEELGANLDGGLSPDHAQKLLEEYGRNEFGDQQGIQPVKILVGQVANALTLVSVNSRRPPQYAVP